MDEVKKSPLAPAHYPARRSSHGKRQEPKAAEKAQEPPGAARYPAASEGRLFEPVTAATQQ